MSALATPDDDRAELEVLRRTTAAQSEELRVLRCRLWVGEVWSTMTPRQKSLARHVILYAPRKAPLTALRVVAGRLSEGEVMDEMEVVRAKLAQLHIPMHGGMHSFSIGQTDAAMLRRLICP